MINVAELIHDPDLCQPYTLYRKATAWLAGRPRQKEVALSRSGVIVPASSKDLLQVPEGDRTKAIIAVYDTELLLVTNETGTSDEVIWHNERYRLFQGWPRDDYGYYKALGERIAGN